MDDGYSFTKQGMVVTSADLPVPHQCFSQGVSLPHVIASDGWLYMIYDTLTPPDFVGGGVTIARASPATPSTWFKYIQRIVFGTGTRRIADDSDSPRVRRPAILGRGSDLEQRGAQVPDGPQRLQR